MKIIALVLCLLSIVMVFGCQSTECLMPDESQAPQAPEVIENPEGQEIPNDARLVCLFFDDCFVNQYEVALPVLLEYDFKATFGVITGHIGTGQDIWEYMDEDELKTVAGHGMDIACHTRTHPDLTANLTDERLREEIVYPKTHLENMGFKVSTIVYPYYHYDNRIIGFVMDAGYTCGRAGWSASREFDPRRGDPKARYHVPSWQITNQDMERFKSIVGGAERYAVVSLVYHFIADDGPVETSTPVENFKAQMAYLNEAGYTVIPLPEVFKD
jgi:peptidoglycan/xylan/chitin deacetylase (PgdA/CDA1 family)